MRSIGNIFKIVFIILLLSILSPIFANNSQAGNSDVSVNNDTSRDLPDPNVVENKKVASTQKKQESSDVMLVEKLYSVWFDFQINSRIKYHTMDHFRLKESKVLFAKGYNASLQYDSLLSSTDVLRDKFVTTTDEAMKWEVAKEIIDAEQKLYELMRLRDRLYAEARKLENSVWENASEEDIANFAKRIKSDEDRYTALLTAQSATFKSEPAKKQEEVKAEPVAVEPKPVEAEPKPEEAKPEKPVVAEKPAVQEVVPVDNSIIYMVQIGAFKNYVPESMQRLYDNLAQFRKIESFRDNRGYLIYVVGKMSDYQAASGLKRQLVQEGVKDAFIVSYRGNVRIPVREALKIQNSK